MEEWRQKRFSDNNEPVENVPKLAIDLNVNKLSLGHVFHCCVCKEPEAVIKIPYYVCIIYKKAEKVGQLCSESSNRKFSPMN